MTLARRLDQFYRFSLREPLLSRWRGFRHRNMPIAMVTGTAGKTTTTRLTAAILEAAGHRVAVATTDGVTVGGTIIGIGDFAGHTGHKIALADRSATAAVLETARGGILRWGFFIRPVTASALLNVGQDHIGIDGIETVEAMAAIKRRVTDAGRHVVLSADNPQTLALVPRYGARRVTLVSLEGRSPVVASHLAAQGKVIARDDDAMAMVLLQPGKAPTTIMAFADIPVTLAGVSDAYSTNAMVAAGLGLALGADLPAIRAGLSGFESTVSTNPGRFNRLPGYPFDLVCDRSMNPHAIASLGELLRRVAPSRRRILCFSMPGNRARAQYDEVPRLVAEHFDHFVIYEMAHYRRGLPEGEITRRLQVGLVAAGKADAQISAHVDRETALAAVAKTVAPDDFVLLIADLPDDLPAIEAAFAQWKTQ